MADRSKTVFITGGSTGIGAAAVRKFAAEGWNVAFADINEEAAAELVAATGKPGQLLFAVADTRDRQAVTAAVDAAAERFGGIDSVFANAGIHRRNTLLDITEEELDLMIQTNIYGTFHTLRAAVPHLIKAGGGTVVINASDQWYIGKAKSFGYGLTKGALGQITRGLSIDLGQYGIRVNAVCAGTVRTPLVDNLFRRLEAADPAHVSAERLWAEENALYPRGRVGEPSEVAEVVYFLASDASSFCTGGHYLVDGGLVAR